MATTAQRARVPPSLPLPPPPVTKLSVTVEKMRNIAHARDTIIEAANKGAELVLFPFGEVVATTEHEETIVVAEIDYSLVEQRRMYLPFNNQRRGDLYQLVDVRRQNAESTSTEKTPAGHH